MRKGKGGGSALLRPTDEAPWSAAVAAVLAGRRPVLRSVDGPAVPTYTTPGRGGERGHAVGRGGREGGREVTREGGHEEVMREGGHEGGP